MYGEDYRSNATSSASGIPTAPGITPIPNPKATLRVVVPRRSQYSQSRGPAISSSSAICGKNRHSFRVLKQR
jgi:hypothetical protein